MGNQETPLSVSEAMHCILCNICPYDKTGSNPGRRQAARRPILLPIDQASIKALPYRKHVSRRDRQLIKSIKISFYCGFL